VRSARLRHSGTSRAVARHAIGARTFAAHLGHAHRLLHKVLARAVTRNTLGRNVAAIVKPPAVEDEEVEVLEPDQVLAIIESLQGHSLHPIVTIALATGMRRGE
jgi:hypothetical protein